VKLARGEAALIISDPLFRRCHDEAWCDWEPVIESTWSADERRAYGAGFGFGTWCRKRGERLRLTRGGVADAETVAALIRCSCNGHLGVPA
jgi:hypothetical protein